MHPIAAGGLLLAADVATQSQPPYVQIILGIFTLLGIVVAAYFANRKPKSDGSDQADLTVRLLAAKDAIIETQAEHIADLEKREGSE